MLKKSILHPEIINIYFNAIIISFMKLIFSVQNY